MEIVKNKEFNGIELYFENKPEKAIIEVLKEAKFRWHNIKKCWFARENQDRLELANKIKNGDKIENNKIEKTVENELGVKVGDIFYMSWGYEQTNVDFFRVEKLRGRKQVILREVYLKIKEEQGISGMSADRIYDVNDFEYAKTSCFIKDNEKGDIKTVNENNYISFDMGLARKYNGQKLYESWYA